MLLIETSRWAPRRRVLEGAPESMHAASIPHGLSPPASLTSKLARMPECRRSENRHYIGISAILAFCFSTIFRFHPFLFSVATIWSLVTNPTFSRQKPSILSSPGRSRRSHPVCIKRPRIDTNGGCEYEVTVISKQNPNTRVGMDMEFHIQNG